MKKICFLIVSIMFLTGCNVEYTLNISEDSIYENVFIISENDNESNVLGNYLKPVEAFVNSPIYSESTEKVPGVEYYNFNKSINNGWYNLNLNYIFNFEEYKNSNIINHSVSIFKFEEKNNEYSLNTGARLKIFDSYNINNLTIKITLDNEYEYISSNANSVFGNEYTWYITKNDYKTRPINLVFKLKEENTNPENPNNGNSGVQNPNNNITNNNNQNINGNEKNSSDDIILIISLLVGFIFVLSLVLIMSKKVRK